MNAKFAERLLIYRDKNRLSFSKTILLQKIENQFSIVSNRRRFEKYRMEIVSARDIQNLLLIEGRAAREYWKLFGVEVTKGSKIIWFGRKPHKDDVANKLLDIGYHYLTQKITDLFDSLDFPVEFGFSHKAQSKKAVPLVYDFIEWLRPFMVDEILLRFVHKKKKSIDMSNKKIIPIFLSKIKQKFEQKYFHRNLDYCITLEYWIKILILEFMGVVNGGKEQYKPIFPSLRHETRCKTCKTKTA